MLQKAGGDPVLAYGLYNAGPGRLNDILSGHAPKETQKGMERFANYLGQYDSNSQAMSDFRRLATGGAADLEGSRYITSVSDKVVAAFTGAATAVEGLATAAIHAKQALDALGGNHQPGATQNYQGGYVSPDGQYVPLVRK
jgi:hypothetical protein